MELFKDILLKKIESGDIAITLSANIEPVEEILRDSCYKALSEIKMILENDKLSDSECFLKIEEIVRVFERLGSNCGNRHDF